MISRLRQRFTHPFFRTVAAGLIGLWLELAPSSSQAQLSPSGYESSLAAALQNEPLTQVIQKHGGRISVLSETTTPRKIAGQWDRTSRTIFIYLHPSSTYEDYKEVLRHEAVHMAQFCNGLNQGFPHSLPIGAIISDAAQTSYSFGRKEALYNDAQEILEAEAYTMEKADDQEVISLIELQCRNLSQ